jgi:mutator protein MutT
MAIVIKDNKVLLIRRANRPDAGRWAFPGGKIEQSETIRQAALRELKEETGVSGEALRIFTAVDAFDRDENGDLFQHIILIAVLCRWTDGDVVAGDDAVDAQWVELEELGPLDLALSLDIAGIARQGASLMHQL